MTDRISDLPLDDRPRERMFKHGASTLSDTELIAVLLNNGRRGKNALQLAREVLGGDIASLCGRELSQLAQIPGVGEAKAARIGAAIEISRRLATNEPEERPLFDAGSFGRRLVSGYSHLAQERLGALFLDSRNRILGEREIYVGTVNTALVSTRDIVRYTIVEHVATGIVLYHNHPSGNPTPSDDDIAFTRKLRQTVELMDVQLVDHLIVGAHRYVSMRERGQL